MTRRTIAAIVASLILFAASSAVAGAAAPPVPEKGLVVFSNAGRIVSVDADGAGRKVLTRKDAPVATRDFGREFLGLGDDHPVASPDGKRIAFVRVTEKEQNFTYRLMLMNRDGSGQRALLRYGSSFLQSVDWISDSRLLVSMTAFQGRGSEGEDLYRQRFMSLGADGKQRRLVLEGKLGDFLATPWLSAQDVSRDGKWLLYNRANMRETQLRVRNLETDEDRLAVYGASEASFAPDGNGIVFTAEKCVSDEDRRCEKGKWLKPGIWTVSTSGNGLRRLRPDPWASSPSYSPDGDWIIFASRRNTPDHDDSANEIYTIATATGKCLTWLTNGSPASVSPSFGPEVDRDYAPRECGPAGRSPLVEIRPLPARKHDPRPRLWAGPQVGGRLLSSLASYWPGGGHEIYVYGDCAYFNPGRCSRALTLESADTCSGFDEIRFGSRWKRLKRRGVPVVRSWRKGHIGGTGLRSGRSAFGVGEPLLFASRKGRPNTFADHLQLIEQLRPVGRPLVPGSKLPAPVKVKCPQAITPG